MPNPDDADDFTPADAVLAEYLERTDRGEKLDREQFIREHPEAGEDLRAYFHSLDTINQALGDTYHPPTRGTAPPGGDLPRDFGSYVLLEFLGAGGMGDVYKAEHRRMERVVAVKTLHARALDSPEAIERFHREVKAAAKLFHPNVVTAFDAGEVDGVHFLAMEYVDGGNLHWLVTRSGPLTVNRAVDYVIQAAQGLEYAHRNRVIHRDVKPANLLLDREGTIKVLDLGLARVETQASGMAPARSESLTRSDQIMGTIDYMAPEQALDTKRAGASADVYSLGCTLFFLLTGRNPYPADTPMEGIIAHRERPIPSLRDLRSDVPKSLDAIFQKMVAKHVEDRYQTMAEAIADLEACRSSADRPLSETISLSTGPTGVDAAPARGTDAGVDSASEDRPPSELPAQPCAKPAKRRQLTRQQILTIAVGLAFAGLLAFSVVITIRTRRGTIVVSVDQPDANVSVDDGKITLEAPGEEPVEIKLAKGEHTLNVAKGGFETFTNRFRLKSGERRVFEVTLLRLEAEVQEAKGEPTPPRDAAAWKAILPPDAPPPAVAPFDAATAKKHQQAWADYLGVPVEREMDLGGGVTMTFVLIPPGEFVMGTSAEEVALFLKMLHPGEDREVMDRRPQHLVRITRPFYLGKHEVTQAQWGALGGGNSLHVQAPSNPVERVSWSAIQPPLEKLNKQYGKEGIQFVLPTEAQWEYACRAGTTTFWHRGNDETTAQEFAWCADNAENTAHPVGVLKPNAWVLHDMHGNVWEWCADGCEADDSNECPVNDPAGSPTGTLRAVRGGSWFDYARHCPSTRRGCLPPGRGKFATGFRLAALLVEEVAGAKVELMRGRDAAAWTALLPPGAPPPAVAPFDAATAKKHQQAWADYLNVPVEQENSIGMKMVLIPPGEFMMGSSEKQIAEFPWPSVGEDDVYVDRGEIPRHKVRITRAFHLGAHEVTVGQFDAFVEATGYRTEAERSGEGDINRFRAGGGQTRKQDPDADWRNPGFQQTDEHPVVLVSWNDAMAFCLWLSNKEGQEHTLPTEAQWEYACRAGTTTYWFFGDDPHDLQQYAWYLELGTKSSEPVGRKLPNPFRVFDIYGNAREWCCDWYSHEYYGVSPVDDPDGPPTGTARVVRGGAFGYHLRTIRSAARRWYAPGVRTNLVGFRVARVPAGGKVMQGRSGKP